MPTTGSANRLLPALKRVVLARDAADRTDGYLLTAYITRQDADAFAVLVKRHGPMVLGVCRRVVGDVHTADDAFQAVFIVLARRAAVVKPREQVGNWLYGVAYRTAIKARAVLARRRSREKQVETMPEPHTTGTPDVWSDLQPVIDEELARLPDKLRVPVVLCDLEGRPQRAVAKQLNLPPATLATRLAAARRALATRLTRRGVTLSGGALAGVLGTHGAVAAVPFRLADAVVRSAEAVATGTAVSSLVSAHAVQLSEGVMRMMLVTKLKAVGVATLTALALTGGLGFGLMPAYAADDPAQPGVTPGDSRPPARQTADKPVDDATFLNRLCLDLLGNPATALEQLYFRADPDGGKRQKVVEWLVADDAVKAFLAQKLKVPVEQIHTVTVKNAADGRVLELVIVGPAELNFTNLTFSPDIMKLAVTVDGPGALVFEATNDPPVTLNGELVLNEKNFDVVTTAKLATFQRATSATRLWAYRAAAQPADPPPALWLRAYNPYQDKLAAWQVDPPAVVEGYPYQLYLNTQPKFTVTWDTKAAPDTDAEFLKRVLTSARGTPPTPLEEKYFAEDKDPKKREKLLDTLLKDPAVAKRLGDDWKKQMLAPPPAAEYRTEVLKYYRLRTTLKTPNPFTKLVDELLAAEKSDEQILDGISLVIVGRLPTMNEKSLTLAAVGKAADRKAAWLDVAKALAGTDEAKKHAAAQKK